jgi:hypothetical protein
MKTELKQERYYCSKVQGPSCRDWKLPGLNCEKTGHIHNYVYKLRDLLARGPGRIYV